MIDKWDERFLKLAGDVATWSKDPSTQVGAVLVSPDRRDIILGYNGFPQGVADDARLHDRATKYQIILHGEHNAILNARRSVVDYTLYTSPFLPCVSCASIIVQSGIRRVVSYETPAELLARWSDSLALSNAILKEAGLAVQVYERE